MCDLWGQFEPLLVQDLAYIVSDEGPHVNTVKAIEFTIIIVGVLMGPSFYFSLTVPRINWSFGFKKIAECACVGQRPLSRGQVNSKNARDLETIVSSYKQWTLEVVSTVHSCLNWCQ